jgi:acyl-CoA synthetase (AMP-forming)/AMP-acid ligase II
LPFVHFLLRHLRASGQLLETVQRILIGGSACPRMLFEAFDAEYGVRIQHGWGMTEMSPIGTYNIPKVSNAHLGGEAAMQLRLKQGRVQFGVDMRIVDDQGHALEQDDVRTGHLQVRGPWVCSVYYGQAAGSALDSEGWFTTGDVASIDTADLLRVYDGKVPKWWLPDTVVVVDELPHTATGKLQKMALRRRYRNYLVETGVTEETTAQPPSPPPPER